MQERPTINFSSKTQNVIRVGGFKVVITHRELISKNKIKTQDLPSEIRSKMRGFSLNLNNLIKHPNKGRLDMLLCNDAKLFDLISLWIIGNPVQKKAFKSRFVNYCIEILTRLFCRNKCTTNKSLAHPCEPNKNNQNQLVDSKGTKKYSIAVFGEKGKRGRPKVSEVKLESQKSNKEFKLFDPKKYTADGKIITYCLYCNTPFGASNSKRKFCPEKYGKKDWCKTKYHNELLLYRK